MAERETGPAAAPVERPGPLSRAIRFFLEKKLVVFLMILFVVLAGTGVAPFDWKLGAFPRDPVPTDAIPDTGENQQIVFTRWMGRSPQDVDDQITDPLTRALMGIPGVKTVRSYSMFGFSTIYVIFKEPSALRFWDQRGEFYWTRSRVLEKLSSLPAGTLPPGVKPALGPDATALGQVFWYTLEGREVVDGKITSNPAGGWDLDELRSIQDWRVRYDLLAARDADGNMPIAEVASIGGFVKEYQVDVDPDAMRAYGVTLEQIFTAVRMSNVDVGARTIEVNRTEYVIRGIGFIKKPADIENTVVAVRENVPVYIRNVARVALGPALRRGALDKEGAEAVGGVVVVRYGENPLSAIKAVRARIKAIEPGLPKKTLPDGRVSQVKVVPFYDRTGLIKETLGTLDRALTEEMLITIIVVLVMIMHLRSSLLISAMLPLAVLMCFAAMKLGGVDANVVALSGIAIAIGTIVDMGIVVSENILKHLDEARPEESRLEVVHRATAEVGGAVLTAIATTVVSFLPIFTMTGPEGKLFKPLAYTKTFALLASVVIALTMLPAVAQLLFTKKIPKGLPRTAVDALVVALGLAAAVWLSVTAGLVIVLVGAYRLAEPHLPEKITRWSRLSVNAFAVLTVGIVLARHWLPLGPENGFIRNLLFVGLLAAGVLGFLKLFEHYYGRILRWCLEHKAAFTALIFTVLAAGLYVWLGPGLLLGEVPEKLKPYQGQEYKKLPEDEKGLTTYVKWTLANDWDGRGKEFMPPLDEGAYLYMPSTMPHASIGESMDALRKQDMAIRSIPEVKSAVGKIGRAETPLDPAPIGMVETIINYKPEYRVDDDGRRVFYKYDPEGQDLLRDENGQPVLTPEGETITVQGRYFWEDGKLVEDSGGRPFRQWRPDIKKPDDIWDEIVRVAQVVGSTGAPRLQPIETRRVMLQTGMRAPMGIKVKGDDLKTIEKVVLDIERLLKKPGAVPSIKASTVNADRVVGKAYLELDWDRQALSRYGVHVGAAQEVLEVAIGGKTLTTTVEGRERYPVRVRYMRELRDTIESLNKILVTAADGVQIPVGQILMRQVEIDLDAPAAKAAGITPAAAAGAIADALLAAGVDQDDFQVGRDIPFPIRVRKLAELNEKAGGLRGLNVSAAGGAEVPLLSLLKLSYPREPWYRRGPMVLKSEDTELVAYVTFDRHPGYAEVDAVEAAQRYLKNQEDEFARAYAEAAGAMGRDLTRTESGALPGLDRRGCNYIFAGEYENQVRSEKKLMVVLPLALAIIFLILYFQFKKVSTTTLVFSGIMVAWGGGFIFLWLYAQPWFLNFSLFDTDMRELFQVHRVNLSVAVWVGFLALFGIASDDGVVMATYLDQSFARKRPDTAQAVREATVAAGLRRIRPCLMTTATTVLALVPVLTSSGRGADVMRPMAIPVFGGMAIEVLTMLVVPVFYAAIEEFKLRLGRKA